MHHLRVAGQRGRTNAGRLVAHALQHITGSIDHPAASRVRNRLQHNKIAEPLQQVDGEPARVVSGVDHRLDRAEQCGGIAGGEGVDGVVDQRDVRGAQQCQRSLVVHPVALGARQQLVEHTQSVAGRTSARADDQWEHRVVDLDGLCGEDPLDQTTHGPRRQQPERVVVRPGPDGGQHLLGLGGREDEDQVLRGLLDDLQQRVEGLRGDHVRFVDDEDAIPALRRGVECPITEIARVVDAVVACRVHFDDVDRTAARPQGDARIAHAAGRRSGALVAVQRAGEDARGGGLAAAARAGEQIGVIDPPGRQGGGQRLGDVFLADHFGERRRSVLAVERHLSRLPTTSDLLVSRAASRSRPAAHRWPARRWRRSGRTAAGSSERSGYSCRRGLCRTGKKRRPA